MTTATHAATTLDQDLTLFRQRRFLAMPLAGTLAWAGVAVAGALLPVGQAAIVLFILTGCIAYLGIGLSRLTGENFIDKTRPKNRFDSLFMLTVAQAVLVYAIAVPFFLRDVTSLPLTVGVLTGLMWLPFGWLVGHWAPVAHGVGRTLLVLAAWWLFPEARMVVVPLVVVACYLPMMAWLELRWRCQQRTQPGLQAVPA